MRNDTPLPDEYRDDRMYVMRISSKFEKMNDRLISASIKEDKSAIAKGAVVLVTYRNTYSLPAIRVDEFESLDEAINYVMRVEPTCPRVSLGGSGPNPTPSWESHLDWLRSEGLKSAAEGDSPTPHWINVATESKAN